MPALTDTKPVGGQDAPQQAANDTPAKPEQKAAEDTIKLWTSRFNRAKTFLDPFFERDQQAFEFYYMWREFRGPYRANIFPPDVHAAVESITPRLTNGRPRPICLAGKRITGETASRVQAGHYALWSIMNMDDLFEICVKRGTWMGFGPEKVTWKTEGHDEQVFEDQPITDPMGQVIGTKKVAVLDAEGKPATKFVVTYHAPVSEAVDPSRVFFPRGYAREEDLPWVLFQYFKPKDALSEKLYELSKLDGEASNKTTAEDLTLERDKVHRLPRKSQVLGQTDDGSAGHSIDSTGQDDEKDNPIIELWEIYERPCKKYPKGRLVTIANRKVILRDRENPMPEGELPLVVFGYIEDTFNLRNIGVGRELERLTLERADKRNQRMENVTRTVDGMTYVQENETVEDSDFEHRPNGIIRLKDLASVQDRRPPDVTPNASREDDMLLADMAKATGANEYVVGGGKRQDEALGQTDILVSSSNERYDGVIRRLERSLNRHARLVHMLVQQNWEDGQQLEWVDANGELQEQDFDPADFGAVSANRVRYDAKSVIAYKELARKQGMQLM